MNTTKKLAVGVAIIALLLATCSAGCTSSNQTNTSGGIVITDSSGDTVRLADTADRIIATNSDAAEVLIAIGAKDKIIGVSDSVLKTPTIASQLPSNVSSIGSWSTPSLEKITALNPDLVITYSSTKPTNIEQFTKASIPVVGFDFNKLNTIPTEVKQLGNITASEAGASTYVQFFNNYTVLVAKRTLNVSSQERPSIYWEGYTSYTTASNGTSADQLVTLAGGNNIAKTETAPYPKVSAEYVITNSPDVIIKVVSNSTQSDLSTAVNEMASRTGFSTINAVQNNSVYALSKEIAYGPRSIVGLLYLAKIFYPDQFNDVTPSNVLTEYSQKFLPGVDQGVFIYPNVA